MSASIVETYQGPPVQPDDIWSPGVKSYAQIVTRFTDPSAKYIVSRAFRILPTTPCSFVLDNGCGTGIVTEAVRAQVQGSPIIASDSSEGMIQHLRQRRIPGVSTMIADAFDLRASGFKPNTFSHAFCNFCLQFGTYPNKGILEMAEVVKPGGLVCVTSWGSAGPMQTLVDILRKQQPDFVYSEEGWRHAWRGKADVEKGMRRAGLEVLVSEVKAFPWDWMTEEDFSFYLFEGNNPLIKQVLAKFSGDVDLAKQEVHRAWDDISTRRLPMETFVTIGRKPNSLTT